MIGTSDTAFPRINNIAFWFLVPSMLFAVLSCIIDEGPGTGWTIKKYVVLKCHFMRETSNIIYIIWVLNYEINPNYSVTIFNISLLVNDQYAWLKFNHQRLNMTKLVNKMGFKTSKPNSLNLDEWFVGLTDGDGCFNIYVNEKTKKIIYTYKLSLLEKNRQLLYKLKTHLKVGSIKTEGNMSHFLIRDVSSLLNIVIPIFDKYPLLTSKRFNYLKFKESLLKGNNLDLNSSELINQVLLIKNQKLPNNYISDHWDNIMNKIDYSKLNIKDQYLNINITDVKPIMSKSWIIGFIEAEGSFYLTIKDKSRIVHGFGLTQKFDYIVLLSMKLILKIPSSVRKKSNCWILDTTNYKNIEYLINYFTYNDNKSYFSGMKSYEFSIWKRAYLKYKGNFYKLYSVQTIMRNYRKINI